MLQLLHCTGVWQTEASFLPQVGRHACKELALGSGDLTILGKTEKTGRYGAEGHALVVD